MNQTMKIKRILIIGSIASGKTTLARKLAKAVSLPIIHVDQIEFNLDLSKKNMDEVRSQIHAATARPEWILDGYGPLDLLPQHLKMADAIVYLDFPYYRSLIRLIMRQLLVLLKPRVELPLEAKEWRWLHFRKMLESLGKQHRLMNPELKRILQKPENKSKVFIVASNVELYEVMDQISRA